MHLSSLPHSCRQCFSGLMCSEAVLYASCPWWVWIILLKPYWLQEAAELSAPSTHQVPSEQHDAELFSSGNTCGLLPEVDPRGSMVQRRDAELWAAGHFQLSLEKINEAAQGMKDSFAIGGCETTAQPMLLVHKSQDAEKTVKSAETGLRSWCL